LQKNSTKLGCMKVWINRR